MLECWMGHANANSLDVQMTAACANYTNHCNMSDAAGGAWLSIEGAMLDRFQDDCAKFAMLTGLTVEESALVMFGTLLDRLRDAKLGVAEPSPTAPTHAADLSHGISSASQNLNPSTWNAGVRRIFQAQYTLVVRKQTDYGPGNIRAFGELRVLVQLSDKLERLKNLLLTRNAEGRVSMNPGAPSNESVEDSYRDLVN